jgi:hypothetical protein
MSVGREYNQDTTSPVELQEGERWQSLAHGADFFNVYQPPFAMTLDALFCVAWCSVAPLKETFPGVPFLSLLGKTPLVLWFARFKDFEYTDAAGARQRMSNRAGALPYSELGIGTLLARRGFFVPSLYASSNFGTRLGLSLEMPKQPTLPIEVQLLPEAFRANLKQSRQQSFIWARLLGSGHLLARIAQVFLPLGTWPIAFPSKSSIQAGIAGTERVQLAHIHAGRLVLDAPWLPRMASFFPICAYVSGMRLQLPALDHQRHMPERMRKRIA